MASEYQGETTGRMLLIAKFILWATGVACVVLFQILPTLIPPLAEWHGAGGHSTIENASQSLLGIVLCLLGFLRFGTPSVWVYGTFAIIFALNF